jgi:hypothetical protein
MRCSRRTGTPRCKYSQYGNAHHMLDCVYAQGIRKRGPAPVNTSCSCVAAKPKQSYTPGILTQPRTILCHAKVRTIHRIPSYSRATPHPTCPTNPSWPRSSPTTWGRDTYAITAAQVFACNAQLANKRKTVANLKVNLSRSRSSETFLFKQLLSIRVWVYRHSDSRM